MTGRRPRWWERRVVSEAKVVLVVQLACYVVAPAALLLSIHASIRLASTPMEVVFGVLGGSIVALLLVVLGMVLPPAALRADLAGKGRAASSREL